MNHTRDREDCADDRAASVSAFRERTYRGPPSSYVSKFAREALWEALAMHYIFRTAGAVRTFSLILISFCLLVGSDSFLRAQSDTGRVVGTVTDDTGAL